MADFVFNIAKGRVSELVRRVDENDPSTAEIVIIPLSASGTKAQGEDFDDVAAVLGDANFTELTTGSWARVDITDAEFGTTDYDPNDTDNRGDVSLPQTSMGSPTAGTTTGVLICYDDTGTDADSALVPLVHCDFAVTADSSEVIINAGDFFRAS